MKGCGIQKLKKKLQRELAFSSKETELEAKMNDYFLIWL